MPIVCEFCDKKSKRTGAPCSKFPCKKVEEASLALQDKTTRRARQRATRSDSQLFAAVNPEDLAAAGVFDR